MTAAKKIQFTNPSSGIQPKGLHLEVVEVTPAMAAEWLTMNSSDNRNLRTRVVQQYARDMKAGRWELTHQGIAFGADGRIVDGQHRLSAVVMADVPVAMVVALNADLTYASSIDRGAARTITDITKLRSDEVAALRILVCFSEADNYSSRSLSAAETFGAAQRFEAELEWMRENVLGVKGTGVRLGGGVAGALAYAWPVAPGPMTEFAHQVVTGEMIVRGDPAYALRAWLTSSAQSVHQWLRALAAVGSARFAIEGAKQSNVYAAESGYRWVTTKRRAKGMLNTPTADQVAYFAVPAGRR